jgi:16S rRNA C1402 N4-methylase RsmH
MSMTSLGELATALFAAEKALKPGGRLVVVTFHSLEDRIVKRFFQDRSGKASGSRHLPAVQERKATFTAIGKQPVVAGERSVTPIRAPAPPNCAPVCVRMRLRVPQGPISCPFPISLR